MRAITLHQPWASLVALGVKSIETRSWSTDYRGRLLIHAGAKSPKTNAPVGEWRTMRWERGVAVSLCRQPSTTPIGEPFLVALPLGAIVASCTLADVVPTDDCEWGRVTPGGWALAAAHRAVLDERQEPYGDFSPGRFAWLLEDVKPTTERCPACWGKGLGPGCVGRWPEATDGAFDPRCCRFPKSCSPDPCLTCDGSGSCDPVPAKGHQRLWNWEPAY